MAKTHPEQSPRRVAKSPLYTRAGDKGETSLFGGQRVAKDNLRVEAYGDIDELNSVIGVAVAFLRQRRPARLLEGIQNQLFDLGAELASEGRAKRERGGLTFVLSADKVAEVERWIDEYDAKVPPLKTFILPAGSGAAAFLHLARTVCRRAERAVVKLAHSEAVNPNIIAYLNRLSDLLFALARYVNKAQGGRERPWRKESG
jgi:cob(I)alamin adenosyltransferase